MKWRTVKESNFARFLRPTAFQTGPRPPRVYCPMKVDVDKVAGAAYITLVRNIKRGEAVRQVPACRGNVIIDLDKNDRIIGIEILNLRYLHPELAEGTEVASDAR